jgi:hypothetical protein
MSEEQVIREALGKTTFEVGHDTYGVQFSFSHVDAFVELSRGNRTVQNLQIWPYRYHKSFFQIWEKAGRGVANLEALEVITIKMLDEETRQERRDTYYEWETLDWETLACILRHVRRDVRLIFQSDFDFTGERGKSFAEALNGHPAITAMEIFVYNIYNHELVDTLFSALAALPSLGSLILRGTDPEDGDESYFPRPERLTELVQASTSLRSVELVEIRFSTDLCIATAASLSGDCNLTHLDLRRSTFPENGGEYILHALKENSILTRTDLGSISFWFFDHIAAILLVNTTLTSLAFEQQFGDTNSAWLSPVFVALGINTTLKFLEVRNVDSADEFVCAALRRGLEMNRDLETLVLTCTPLDDPESVLWREVLPFLSVNGSLKRLTLQLGTKDADRRFAALCVDTVSALQNNASLDYLEIGIFGMDPSEYAASLESLQQNPTLKTLLLHPNLESVTCDEKDRVVAALEKNYMLESLDDAVENSIGHAGTILRFNKAGRRYMIEDTSSFARGVEVLIAVRDNLACLHYHLLENPSLCDTDRRY